MKAFDCPFNMPCTKLHWIRYRVWERDNLLIHACTQLVTQKNYMSDPPPPSYVFAK